MSLVSFVKVRRNAPESIRSSILESLDLVGYRFSKEVKNVVIKPNLCYYWDRSTGQTTDPDFIASLVSLLRQRISPNVDVSIVESDASAMKCKHVFKMLGYEKLSRDQNVRLVNLSEDDYSPLKVTVDGHVFTIMVPETIRKAELKINVPKIKYMRDPMFLTCALKNVYGCNPYARKSKLHADIERAIVGLNKAMGFNLCIVDGISVSGTQPRMLGLVMASEDPVAVDVAAARIAGLNPSRIKYIKVAASEGLGSSSFVEKGSPMRYFSARYPKRTVRDKVMSTAYRLMTLTRMSRRIGLE